MHLMYYLGDDGKRIYTLKVCSDWFPSRITANTTPAANRSAALYLPDRRSRPRERRRRVHTLPDSRQMINTAVNELRWKSDLEFTCLIRPWNHFNKKTSHGRTSPFFAPQLPTQPTGHKTNYNSRDTKRLWNSPFLLLFEGNHRF